MEHDSQYPLGIHMLLQEQWGGQGDLWSGQVDPDPMSMEIQIFTTSLLLYERMHHVTMELGNWI